MGKVITGPAHIVRPIAIELLLLGIPTGMRREDDDTYRLELPAEDWLAIEKVHVSWFISKRKDLAS